MRRWLLALGLSLLAIVLFNGSYQLIWWLVFIALSPLVVLVATRTHWWSALLWGLVTTWAIFFFLQQPMWVFSAGGIAVLALYQSALLLPGLLAMWGAWRRHAVPLWIGWPFAWVGSEYLRMLGDLANPFGTLAVPGVDQTLLMQVLDLGGTYAVILPITVTQGFLAECAVRLARRDGQPFPISLRAGAALLVSLWLAVLLYGHFRYEQIAGSLTEGPRVAVIQPDAPFVPGGVASYDSEEYAGMMQALTDEALQVVPPPDWVLWPEALDAFPLTLPAFYERPFDPGIAQWLQARSRDQLEEESLRAWWEAERTAARQYAERFREWTGRVEATVLVGMFVRSMAEDGWDRSNAVVAFGDDSRVVQEKVKLYPLGEYAPWDGTWLAPILDRWFTPAMRLVAGETRQLLPLDRDQDEAVIAICSEIMFPQTSGVFLQDAYGEKAARFLLNNSNEGALQRNRAQLYHFAGVRFRAIEGRFGVARSSNTGISGFVLPTGEPYGLVTNEEGEWWTGQGAPEMARIEALSRLRREEGQHGPLPPDYLAEVNREIAAIEAIRAEAGIEGWSVAPLYQSPVTTLYTRWGDWLPWCMLIGTASLALLAFLPCRKLRFW